jgi:hypothetical protein
VEWLEVAKNIDHEFYVVHNLRPNVTYQFRLAARNRIGWSEKGIPTPLVRTKEEGMNKKMCVYIFSYFTSPFSFIPCP